MVLSSLRTLPLIIKHETPQLLVNFLLISSFKCAIVAVWKSGIHISFVSPFHTCCTTSFSNNASGLNSNSMIPLNSGCWLSSSLADGLLGSEVLKNFNLPFAQEAPSITKGLDNDCLASTIHTPRYTPPTVMSTSAAEVEGKGKMQNYSWHNY